MARYGYGYGRSGGSMVGRLVIAGLLALISLCSYYGMRERNPITDQVQHVAMTPQQEIALGLQAAPQMAQQHGGLHPDRRLQERFDQIGNELLSASRVMKKSPYKFDFHVLRDEQTINAFALPGGQVFITAGLLERLRTDGQVAGVLGHEIGHVIERHGAEHLAKAQLTQGLTGAVVIATYDPNDPRSRSSAAVAMAIGQLINMKYGRDDELESDRWGVRLLADAGYNPEAMIHVMEVLRDAAQGRSPPEFFSTHPNPGRRIDRIREAIAEEFPNGVPTGLRD